jgi:hypothetical protein
MSRRSPRLAGSLPDNTPVRVVKTEKAAPKKAPPKAPKKTRGKLECKRNKTTGGTFCNKDRDGSKNKGYKK